MTLDLNGHTIKKSEIVGIGPIMMELTTNPADRALYKSMRLQYLVHLRNQSIRVESPWFDFEGHEAAVLKENKDKFGEWERKYQQAKKDIIDNINSDLP